MEEDPLPIAYKNNLAAFTLKGILAGKKKKKNTGMMPVAAGIIPISSLQVQDVIRCPTGRNWLIYRLRSKKASYINVNVKM